MSTTDKFKSIVIRSKNESGQNNSLRISFVDRKIFFNYLSQIKIYALLLMCIQGIFGKFVHNGDFSTKF